MAKQPNVEIIKVTSGSGGGSRELSLISPSQNGSSVNLRPSAKAVAEMRKRGVTHVEAQWEKVDGKIMTLCVIPAKRGKKIRYDVGNLRPHVHISTRDVGTATIEGLSICPREEMDGDAFRFFLPAGMSFAPQEQPR